MEIVILVVAAGFVLWLMAVVDLIGATDMDPVGRLIVAGALLFVAPVGVLLWLIVRKGRLGLMVATLLVVGTVALFAGVFATASWRFGSVQSSPSVQRMEVVGGAASGEVGQSAVPGTP